MSFCTVSLRHEKAKSKQHVMSFPAICNLPLETITFTEHLKILEIPISKIGNTPVSQNQPCVVAEISNLQLIQPPLSCKYLNSTYRQPEAWICRGHVSMPTRTLHKSVHIYMYIYIHTYMYIYICIYIHTYIYIYIHVYIPVCIYTSTYIYIYGTVYRCTCGNMCVYIYIHVYS